MKKLVLFVVVTTTLAFQISLMGASYAAPGSADLEAVVEVGYLGALIGTGVCNDGDESVEQFKLTIDSTTNYTVTSFVVNPDPNAGGSDAIDPGSIDSNTGVWTGLVRTGECVSIFAYGDVTGSIGDDLGMTVSVSDSLLEGSTPNVDPNSTNDSATMDPFTIRELPDVAIQTRLLTEGEIADGSNVSYEVFYHNVGEGYIPQAEPMASVISFVVPDAASFTGIVDLDEDDVLSSDPDMCFNYGSPSNLGTGLADVDGTVMVCLLQRTGDLAPHTSYPFQYNMTATQDFASGAVDIFAMVSGPDLDTLRLQQALFTGENPFTFLPNVNNLVSLSFDSSDLIPFINRCSGQSEVTLNGEGCFRISFNKKIWAPSFEQSDLAISAGTITGFTQIDELNWEVTVSGILPGQTATLTLVEGSVLDYSAVENGVQVLGENAIRFDLAASGGSGDVAGTGTATGVASGTLPKTGAETQWPTGLVLLLIGFGLLTASKKGQVLQRS